MKKITIIILLILSVFFIGCSKEITADSIPATIATNATVETTSISKTTINNDYDNLKIKYDKLVEENKELAKENQDYNNLISNLNDLLKNVYYGYARNDKYILDGFTAFSMEYKGKYYLVTAGHCIENECGKFGNFKFKANFSNDWIYPKLLDYNNDEYAEKDFAIFTDSKINSGFKTGKIYGQNIVLGNIDKKINIIRNVSKLGIAGESGSPIINLNGEVIGILTGGITNIDIVLSAIDNLK